MSAVLAEYLTEEAPDGRDGVEQAVPVPDALFVEDILDAGLSQNIGKGQPRAACETGTDRLEVRHGVAFRRVEGRIGHFWIKGAARALDQAVAGTITWCIGAVETRAERA